MSRTAKIELKQSICTDTPIGSDLFALGDGNAKHLKNTGMERNGGITPIYEQETTFPTAGVSTMIAKDGTVIQVDASNNVRLDDTVIGNVGPYTVNKRGSVPQYIDAVWTLAGTLIGIKRNATVVTIDEYDPVTKTVIHTRTATFAGMPANPHKSMYIIRYVDMAYADMQEFMVNQGGSGGAGGLSYRLRESDLSTTSTVIAGSDYQMYRFSAGKYIMYEQGVGNAKVGDIGAFGAGIDGKWITIDRFPGTSYSRAIVSFDVYKNAANMLTGFAYCGYTIAGAWSATLTYVGVALAAVTAVVSDPINGPGYSEATYTRSDTATNIWCYYAPQWDETVAALGVFNQETDTHTPINAYGKLSDIFGNLNTYVQIRLCFINGVPSYLSAAPVSSVNDCIGIPLINVGEINPMYPIQIEDNNSTLCRILYKYNNIIYFVELKQGVGHSIQKISDSVYEINCISAFNAIHTLNRKIRIGVNDFNGRMLILGDGSGSAAPTQKYAVKITSQLVNSIDTGDKLSTSNYAYIFTTLSRFKTPGADIPSFVTQEIDYGFDYYINDVYFRTAQSYFSPGIVKNELTDTLYVPDTRIPFAMGYQFQDRTMQTEIETIFTGVGVIGGADIDFDYLCYELGNDIPGLYQSFVLFGQTFLFDGKQIWFASFNGSLFAGRGSSPVCPATGMQLIASSPTEIFFLSLFDDSIYSFDGGRSLKKVERMNDLRNSAGVIEPVLNGVFSIRDNALLLQTAGTFIWVRDKIVSQNNKKANQISIGLYDTVNGIAIANNTLEWIYSFLTLAASTVVPLIWQSGYFGVTENKLGIFSAFVANIYNASKGAASVMFTLDGFDIDGEWHEDIPFNIKPGDWTPNGFYRARIVPQHTVGLALSVGMKTLSYLVLNEMVAEFTPSVSATPAASRSH